MKSVKSSLIWIVAALALGWIARDLTEGRVPIAREAAAVGNTETSASGNVLVFTSSPSGEELMVWEIKNQRGHASFVASKRYEIEPRGKNFSTRQR